MALFNINDALIKQASQHMPTAQLIFVRGMMAGLLVLAVSWRMGVLASLGVMSQRWVLTRAGIEAIASFLYLAALFQLPIANATAINLSSPLFIAVLAGLFLGERVSGQRWLAILAGFGGVLLVIQPTTDGFNVYAWLCLLATLFHAARDLVTRRIAHTTPSILITLATTLAVILMAGSFTLIQGWQPIGWPETGLLALASIFLAGGYYAMVSGVRQGEVSLVAPFRYTGLLWALILGYLVWGDIPNALAWVGIALLIGAGLWMIAQERARDRAHT